MGGVEVFKDGQAFLEVRHDRRLDDLTGRLGHQAAHTRQLLHLVLGTTSTGVGHHVDRVDLVSAAVFADLHLSDLVHHGVSDIVSTLRPGVDHLVVLLALGDETVDILLLVIGYEVARRAHQVRLGVRDEHVVLTEGNAGLGRFLEAQPHDLVTEDDRRLLTAVAVDGVDQATNGLLDQQLTDHVRLHFRMPRQQVDDHFPARRGFDHLGDLITVGIDAFPARLDLGVQGDDTGFQRRFHLRTGGKGHALARLLILHDGKIVEAQDDILRRDDDRLAVGRREDVVGRHHQRPRFQLGFQRERNVNSHLVAVEVGVEGGTDQRVQLDGLAFDQLRLERLDAESVQRRRTVQHDRVFANDLVEHVPDFRTLFLDQFLGLLDGTGQTLGVETRIDKGFEQFERHFLRQAALMQLEVRTHDDHGTAGIVDALAEQVLAETALLTLEHVRQRLQRALVGTGDDAATTAIVEQGVDGFLQHPLLVPDNDIRRAQLDEALEAVVTVDHTTIEVVQVRRRETAAIERHQRTQFRRNDRHDRQDHPLRAVAGCHEVLEQLETLGVLLQLQLGTGFLHVFADLRAFFFQIHIDQDFAHGLGADAGSEGVLAILVLRVHEFFFGKKLERLQRGQARLDDDIAFKVEHALHILERHVEDHRDARRQGFQEPDVSYRSCQLDMAHTLATNARQGHFNAALLADDALVLDTLILAAQALIVLDRTKDARTEQAITLRLEGPVVDGLGLLHLAEGPGEDLLRAGQGNTDPVEGRAFCCRIEDVHDVVVHVIAPKRGRREAGPPATKSFA